MGIKTSDFIPNLPPKDFNNLTETEIATFSVASNWLSILDFFDPSILEPKFLNECARRNPYETCYRWEEDGIPHSPVEERLRNLEANVDDGYDLRVLKNCIELIEREGLNRVNYNNARVLLIKCIGMKGALEYVRREYERLGAEGRKKQEEAYNAFEREWQARRGLEELEYDDAVRAVRRAVENGDFERGDFSAYNRLMYLQQGETRDEASVHEKVILIRKGMLCSDGKPLNQRDFAKLLGYPISKYAQAETTDRWQEEEESLVEYELLDSVVK